MLKKLSEHLNLLLLGLFSAPLLVLGNGCIAGVIADPYSLVAEVCMTQDPQMGQSISTDASVLAVTYLTPECKKALAGDGTTPGVIPFDEASFATAPTGFRDKVIEAFQAIIAYPVDVTTDGKYLGTSPEIAGAIPLDFYTIYQQSGNPNQALFNFILNQVDKYVYATDGGTGETARYFPAVSTEPRQVKIFPPYWDPTDPREAFRNPFVRASTLAHESYHGTGILHENCDPDKTQGSTGFGCDAEIHGAYGFGATYLKFLLHGSATCSTPGCTPPITPTNVMLAGYEICRIASSRLNTRYAELQMLVGNFDCYDNATADWTMQQEGLLFPTNPNPSLPAKAALQSHGPGLTGSVCTAH